VALPVQREYAESSWHLYVLRVNEVLAGIGRDALFMRLRDQGIGVNVHYLPVHTQPYYRQKGFRDGYCPNAERYSSETITLPLFFDLTDEDQAKVIKALRCAI
jgi:dTDP-4-amino-4,6-dideoxygalactose transaminase